MPQTIKVPLGALKVEPEPAVVTVPLDQLQAEPAETTPSRTWGDTAADVATGVVKGVGNTVFGLGKIVHDYTPIGRISDVIQPGAFTNKPPELTPTNAPQKLGYYGEQVGEFFVPVAAAGKLAKGAEAVKSGVLSLAQSGSPLEAGVSAGLTAVLPGGGAAKRAASSLEQGAEKTMAQALGATKEPMKQEAMRLAPQMLARGVKGSRPAMLEQASANVAKVGQEIGAEIQAASQAGKTVNGQAVRDAIRTAADAFTTYDAQGRQVVIEGAQPVVSKLMKLEQFVKTLPDDISFEQANRLKQTWDRIVSKSGLYTNKATATGTDNANAWAVREGASAFRNLLAKGSPTLDDLNKEYKFWKGLQTVLTETERRTQAQSGGLISAGMGGSGAVVGALSGDSAGDRLEKALVYGVAGRNLVRVMQSPAWRTRVSAPMKQMLANALATGNASRFEATVSTILRTLPAEFSQATAQ